MRHGRKVKKLGRKSGHRKAMITNLLCSLLTHERVRTTQKRAQVVKSLAEKMIALAQDDSLANRRQVQRLIRDKKLVKRLFTEIAARFKDRVGGYCRIVRLGFRPGDNAEMALLELVAKGEKK